MHARCGEVGCMAREAGAVRARCLARSVAQVPRPGPIPELVSPAEPRSARHGWRFGMCRPYSPRFAPPSAPRISPAGYLACSAPICLALAVRAELGEQRAISLCLLS